MIFASTDMKADETPHTAHAKSVRPCASLCKFSGMTRSVDLSFLSNTEFNQTWFTMTGYVMESEGRTNPSITGRVVVGIPVVVDIREVRRRPRIRGLYPPVVAATQN